MPWTFYPSLLMCLVGFLLSQPLLNAGDTGDKASEQPCQGLQAGWVAAGFGISPCIGQHGQGFTGRLDALGRLELKATGVLPSPLPQPFAGTVTTARREAWCSPTFSKKSNIFQIPR